VHSISPSTYEKPWAPVRLISSPNEVLIAEARQSRISDTSGGHS